MLLKKVEEYIGTMQVFQNYYCIDQKAYKTLLALTTESVSNIRCIWRLKGKRHKGFCLLFPLPLDSLRSSASVHNQTEEV